MTTPSTLETKSTSADVAAQFDDFMTSFQAFRDANDERLAEIERRGGADPVTTDKLARIERTLDTLSLKSQRPHLGGTAPRSVAHREHKAAFDTYVRRGEAALLAALEAKSLSVTSGPDGGYLVPPETETAVMIAAQERLADPRHRRRSPSFGVRLQEAVLDLGPRHGLGRRDRGTARDHVADAR